MSQVSRPMQIALAATMLFALVWFVALRPKPAGGGESAVAPAPAPAVQTTPAAPGTEGLTSAVDKAEGAVATADGDAQRAEQSSADGGGSAAAAAQPAAKGGETARAAGGGAVAERTGSPQVRAVRTALRRHKAVAIAFVDPHTADARAVAGEVRGVSRFNGRALALAVPLARLSDFAFITNTVEVTVAPTIVVVDPRRRATTIVGFADRGEIEQRLADALAVRPGR